MKSISIILIFSLIFYTCSSISTYKIYSEQTEYDRLNEEFKDRPAQVIRKNGDVHDVRDIHIDTDSTSWLGKSEPTGFFTISKRFLIFSDTEVNTETNDDDLILLTKDSTFYAFESNMYQFKNDSIDGIATVYGMEETMRVQIALKDIVGTLDETDEYSGKAVQEPLKKCTIATSDIEKIILANRGNGALAGAVNGFLVGSVAGILLSIFGLLLCEDSSSGPMCREEPYAVILAMGIVFGLIGAPIGLVAGYIEGGTDEYIMLDKPQEHDQDN